MSNNFQIIFKNALEFKIKLNYIILKLKNKAQNQNRITMTMNQCGADSFDGSNILCGGVVCFSSA